MFFSLTIIIITLENITTCSWNDCKKLEILKKFALEISNVQITNSIENVFDTLLRSCCVALVCILQQMSYSTEQVQEPQKDEALCNSCEELQAVNYYCELLHLSYGRVHGSVSDN